MLPVLYQVGGQGDMTEDAGRQGSDMAGNNWAGFIERATNDNTLRWHESVAFMRHWREVIHDRNL